VTLVEIVENAGTTESKQAYAAIGPHLRHCVDHMQCLLRGLESGVVDYDAREREEILEIDASRMRQRLARLADELREIDPAGLRRPLRVRMTAALGSPPETVESNLEREIVFLSGHNIHHIAIMALLVREHGVAVPEGLDMAFSTAEYLRAVDPEAGG
jgi:hypothetical protein